MQTILITFVLDITNFLDKSPSELAKWLQEWGVNVTSDEVKIGIPVLLFFSFIIIYLIKWINNRRKTNKWRISQIRNKLGREAVLYNEEKKTLFKRAKDIFRGSNNIYIETRFQSNPPHDKEDPEENIYSEPSQNLMDFYLKNVLIPDNKAPFIYCILAGSGMGKTTFAINLLKRYINKYTEETKPYDIFLFSLENDDVFHRIQEIEVDKRPSSILILDAVDENNLAVNDYSSFKNELEKSIKNFAIVIVTCRTQFFLNEESEPDKSNLTYYSKDGSRTFEKYYKHYISVFNNDDIKCYLKKKYPLKKKRRKAEEIVSMCKSLMVRPLLLSGIDDLLQEGNKRILNILDIYEVLIEKWLEREVNFWGRHSNSTADLSQLKESLYDFSKKLAVKIYREKDKYGGLFIPEQELKNFMKRNNFTMEYSYKGRSLVNRDSKGNIKFAHKSFLEYFLAVQMFQDGDYHTLEGLDFMTTIYTELCRKEFKELKSQGIIDFDEATKSIIIYKNINYNSLCFDWVSHIKNIFISSDAIDGSVLIWLRQLPFFTLFIFNYVNYYNTKKITLLNELLKLNNLKVLAIIGNYRANDLSLSLEDFLTFQKFKSFFIIKDGHFSSKKDIRDILRKIGNTLIFQFKSFDEILSLIYDCCKADEKDSSTAPIDARLDYEELIEELKYYKINIEIDKLKKHNSLGGIAISIRSQIPSVKEQVSQNRLEVFQD